MEAARSHGTIELVWDELDLNLDRIFIEFPKIADKGYVFLVARITLCP